MQQNLWSFLTLTCQPVTCQIVTDPKTYFHRMKFVFSWIARFRVSIYSAFSVLARRNQTDACIPSIVCRRTMTRSLLESGLLLLSLSLPLFLDQRTSVPRLGVAPTEGGEASSREWLRHRTPLATRPHGPHHTTPQKRLGSRSGCTK